VDRMLYALVVEKYTTIMTWIFCNKYVCGWQRKICD